MRVIHVCLSCFYIDGYNYQENQLVQQHVDAGHDVSVIAATENLGPDGKLCYDEPSTYMGTDGAMVQRLAYHPLTPGTVGRKLRIHRGVMEILEREQPDVIMFHGLCGWELQTVVRYKQKHPNVVLNVDSHESPTNSAIGRGSFALHRYYYRPIIKRVQESLGPVLCVATDTMQFVQDMYEVPADQVEFFPLGGVIPDDSEYAERRARGREKADVGPDQIMLMISGKLLARRNPLETLRAFIDTPGDHLRLRAVGVFGEELRDEAMALIDSDDRVEFLGWADPDQLSDYLAAADVYVQPTGQSATMQASLCHRTPVAIDGLLDAHEPYIDGNGWGFDSETTLASMFADVANGADLESMSLNSLAIARRLLDYRQHAERILVDSPAELD